MDIIKINEVSFQYPDREEQVLEHFSLEIADGSFVVIGGPSGSGKTTLLRLLKKEVAPVGHLTGEMIYRNKRFDEWDERILIEEIGFVFQDPENQIVLDEVLQEMVFGMENLGYSHVEMRKRVAELVHFFGIESLLEKKTSELSGGQKQMLNLLSVLLLKPSVLLLDEPTSQLDPVAAKDFITMLERLNKEMGMTIVIVEHRLEELFAIADEVLFMQAGKVAYYGNSRTVISNIFTKQDEQFLPYVPSVARLYLEKEQNPDEEKIPLTVKESQEWLATATLQLRNDVVTTSTVLHEAEPILSLQNVYFQYNRHASMVIKNLSLDIQKGEFFCLVGGNGSGKTTLLKLCAGIVKAQRGKVKYAGKDMRKWQAKHLVGKIAYLPQNPQSYFIHDTIEQEMKSVIAHHQLDDSTNKIQKILEMFQIAHLRDRHPYDCSGGEIQRAALACMLLGEPELVFIDEPTKGLDILAKEKLAQVLKQLHKSGLTIVMVTHDIEFAAKYVDRCAMMFDGEISVDGTPEQLFKGNYFYTTTINRATRMSESHLPEVLTLEEALLAW